MVFNGHQIPSISHPIFSTFLNFICFMLSSNQHNNISGVFFHPLVENSTFINKKKLKKKEMQLTNV